MVLLYYKRKQRRSGEIGRRTGLKIPRRLTPCRFESDLRHQSREKASRMRPFLLVIGRRGEERPEREIAHH